MKVTKNAYQTAIVFLSRREYAAAELKMKLQQKGFQAAVIHAALAELQQDGLQSDKRYANFQALHAASLGYGPLYVQQKLQHLGIDKSIIAEAIDLDNTWQDAFHLAWHKHNGGKIPGSPEDRAKLARYLHYRGFSDRLLSQHLKELPSEIMVS